MKITKTPKRLAEPMPEVNALLQQISEAADDELPNLLDGISEWCWPRGDLHYWVHVLNRFDSILEETCRDYDLHKLQINEFTPLRKRILCSILKFSRMLVENCTSRKLYNSYEHLINLLMTRDVDILEATLRLMLRFAQQQNSQHPKAELVPAHDKLATLAVTWPPRDHGLEMVDIAKEQTVIPPALLSVKFQFYRRREVESSSSITNLPQINDASMEDGTSVSTPIRPRPRDRVASSTGAPPGSSTAQGSTSTAPQEGIDTIELGRPSELGSNAMDVLADVIEKTQGIPSEDHFELYQRIRLAMSMPNLEQRRQLLVCRLLAIACYAHLVPESTASTQLFLYEPEIVPRLAALVNPTNELPVAIISASLYALDALGRYRSKLHEVLGSLNASVNHGILLQVLRNIVEDLSTGSPTHCDEYIDAYLGLVSFITSTNVGSSLVVGAGLLQLLVKLVDTAQPNSYMIQRTVTRAIGLLDSVIYAYVPAFGIFCQAQGLVIFVRRIEEEVDFNIEEASAKMDLGEDLGPDRQYGKLTFGRAHLLKGYLQSISHMMVSTGTADGLRNLIDTSLLTSIKKIMENRSIIGPQNLALSISIMATFVHNEPTSLGIIQEKKLPEAFLQLVKEDIEAQFDVINAIPNAIQALCLNQAGLDTFNAESIIDRLLSILTSERHIKILQDQDNVTVFGASIDELVRHQPTMKQAVMDGVFKVLDAIHAAGRAFEAKETEKASMYRLSKVELGESVEETESTEVLSASHQGMALADVIMDEPDVFNKKDDALKDPNPVASFMDVTARFLEVLFQSSNHCKDFLRADGLEKLLQFYNLPCLSYNFASTVTADSMVHLLRFISDISSNTVITALLREVKSSLEETKPIWTSTDDVSALSKLLKPTTDEELTACNEKFRQLIKLNARMQLLSDVAPTFTYSGSKTPTTLLQVLNTTPSIMAGNRDVATITDLGDFQRAWIWETVLFKAATHSTSKAARLHDSSSQATSEKTPLDSLLTAPLFQRAATESEPAKASDNFDPNSPLVKNTTSLRYIASQVKVALQSFFLETNRLLVARRTHDASHKRYAQLTATQLGSILKQNIQWKPHSKVSLSCDYLIVMIAQATKLLYEERSTQPMHAQTIVLVAFVKQGGLTQLLDVYSRFSDELGKQCDADGTLIKESSGINDALHAGGGLQTSLDLLHKMVNHSPLLDSPSTQTLKSKDGMAKDSAEYFEPKAFLIHLRLTIAPVIRQTWTKAWLTSVNFTITRSVLRIILKLAEGQGETPSSSITPLRSESGLPGAPGGVASAAMMGLAQALGGTMNDFGHGAAPVPRQRTLPVADESRLRQLTDMGFPRRAARHALVRCNNNLAAATEYLLMHPEIVHSMQGGEVDGVPAAAPAANGETAEDSTQEPPSGVTDVPQEVTPETAVVAPEGTQSSEAEPASEEPSASQESIDSSSNADTPMADPGEGAEIPKEVKEASKANDPSVELVQLQKHRSEMMETLLSRSLELSDKFEDLVFDVRIAVRIATQSYLNSEPLKALFQSIEDAAPEALSSKMAFVAVRLHLLALIFNDQTYALRCASTRAQQFVQSLTTLIDVALEKEEDGVTPTWMPSLLLVLSAIFQAEDVVPEAKMIDKEDMTDHEMPRIRTAPLFEKEMPKLLNFSMQKLGKASKLSRDDLSALYRFLVILTRRSAQASAFFENNGLALLMQPFATLELNNISRCRIYAVLILRHIIESHAETLHSTMTQEVRSFLCQSRVKVMDTTSTTKSLGAVILREPDVFLDIVKNNIELVDYKPAQGQGVIKLLEAKRTEGASDAGLGSEGRPAATSNGSFLAPLERNPDDSMDLVPPSPTKAGASMDEQILEVGQKGRELGQSTMVGGVTAPASLDAVMHFLLSELIRCTRERTLKKQESSVKDTNDKTEQESSSASDASYFYICFLLQSLTELLSSYKACKVSFLNFTKKRFVNSTLSGKKEPVSASASKPRLSGSALTFFLSELVPIGFVQSREHEEMRRLMSISNWAMSAIVALCADVVAITTDLKDVGNEVVFARKSVLDAVAKAIKEATSQGQAAAPGRASEGIESRYGRLYSLSDLCYRLLKARPNVTSAGSSASRSLDDLTLHMAKTMLERNFVTVLTNAVAEVDLNLPMVKSLLDRILKPLEYLTKVAIKMNKAERKVDQRRSEEQDADGELFQSMEDDEVDDEDESSEDEQDEEPREETPDFYRNSSLGIHTGDLETANYDEDEDEDDDEDEEMEEGMEGVVYSDGDTDDSDDDDDDIDEEHIVEVMEEDDEDSEEEDSDEEGDDEEEEEGVGSWVDEDDEDEEEGAELDFIIEGDAEEAQRLFQQAGRMFQGGDEGANGDDEEGEEGEEMGAAPIAYDVHEVEGEDSDEEEEEMMDDDDESVLEGIFEHGDLSTMQAPTSHDHAPMDRFGATWTWTNNAPPNSTTRAAGVSQEQAGGSDAVISPFAFLRQRSGGNRAFRSRRMIRDEVTQSITPAPPHLSDGRLGAFMGGRGEDVASHPLLMQSSFLPDSSLAPPARLSRHHALRRGGRGEEGFQDWAQSLEGLMEGGAMQFLETLLQRNGAGQGGPGEAIHISMAHGGMPRMSYGGANPMIRSRDSRGFVLDGTAALNASGASRSVADPVTLVQDFAPVPTLARWSEGMRIIAGSQAEDRLRHMRAHIVNTLRPAWLITEEEKRKKKEKHDEERAKIKEAAEKEKAAKEAEETAKRAEEKLKAETEAAAATSQIQQDASTSAGAEAIPSVSTDSDVEMTDGIQSNAETTMPASTPANLELNSLQQGLDELDSSAIARAGSTTATASEGTSAANVQAATPTPAAPRVRATTTINGNEIDITDSGIDPTFLEALPEDMREEVLNQHFRERRAAEAAAALAAAGPGPNLHPSSIAPEFLEALPPEIRAEVIQQEAAENERRRREERRAEGGAGAEEAQGGPSDMDPASFLASLNPDLRGAVLMEQDESFLNSIPASMRQEVEAIRRHSQLLSETRRRLHHRSGGMPGLAANGGSSSRAAAAAALNGEGGQDQSKKAGVAPRDAIQLLDKAGIAALVRLLFFPLMDSNQSGLREVLVNLSENSKSRFELLNLLLMILAEGASEDSHAVDKSYNNMSSRINKASSSATPKRSNTTQAGTTVTALQAGATPSSNPTTTPGANTVSSSQPSLIAPLSRAGYEAPFLIASRSIETLIHLTSANEQAAYYFLKDDPSNVGLMKWFKKNANIKGKEKDKVTSNAPINILLVLLGKPSILANAQLVDNLISLLNTVTRPLPTIVSSRRKAEEDESKKAKDTEEVKAKAIEGAEVSTAEKAVEDGENKEEKEVQLPMSAPQISEERMATVVKPLSISISSKGFQNTLAVASNLSTVEGARDVITSALQTQARSASKTLLSELDDLLNELPAPVTSGKTEEQEEEEERENADKAKEPTQQLSCPALTKLASPSSSQTVILRSLRALEWVMTRPKTVAPSTSGTSSAPVAGPSGTSHSHHHHHHTRHYRYINGPQSFV